MLKIPKKFKYKIEIFVCKNCKKPFLRMKKKRTNPVTPLGVLPFNRLTCSKKCSKEYNRIRR